VVGCRFGSEDRFKHFGQGAALERTSSGMLGGGTGGQVEQGPGPSYNPSYSLVKSASRASSFTVERREGPGGAAARATVPGPGLYNPSDKTTSAVRNYVAGGGFLSDDRHRYLGEVDPASLTPAVSDSPGPMYMPTDAYARRRAPTVAFGGKGPGTIMQPPTLKTETPGPGTYTPTVQNACLSTKRRVPGAKFGIEQRSARNPVDSVHCYHGTVCCAPRAYPPSSRPPSVGCARERSGSHPWRRCS
jgi:hypothetical protein